MAVYNVGFKFGNKEDIHYMMVKTEREGLDAIMEKEIWKNMSHGSAPKSEITVVSAELIWKDGVEANDIVYQFVRLGDLAAMGMRHFDIGSNPQITEKFMDISRGLRSIVNDVAERIDLLISAIEEYEEHEKRHNSGDTLSEAK